MRRKLSVLTAVLAAGTVALAGCGSSNTDAGASSNDSATTGDTAGDTGAPAGDGSTAGSGAAGSGDGAAGSGAAGSDSAGSGAAGSDAAGSGASSAAGSAGGAAGTDQAGCDMTAGVKDASSMQADSEKSITIGSFSGWDESTATAYLMKNVLESDGYTVDVKTLDAAPAFVAAAKGDVDVLTDVWLPTTHKTYIDKYGDQLEPLGCWYDNAKLTIAVNSSSPAKSIEDLKSMAGEYNNTLVGIEPGAGETGVVKDTMIPAYGLQDITFTTSSTSAMLASIVKAEKDKTNVAVTLWKPHWAYAAYDIRDLEDPKGAMGGKEGLWNYATKGFEAKYPKAAQLFKNMIIPDADLSELEDLMTQKYDGKNPDAAVDEWLKGKPEFAKQLAAGELK
ncbi:glycine betaine ABC transporter substrate-binding protein [Nakamurella sp. DB0629]|uniref:Glycine betaine ABC transporter substrate-binding protein n=2 Tax=Nakamurella aerolata TaxID=1656892 RepID=A0A849AJ33_9ACTN|nr:glycine betaine ABC transporter substrate-binding protein [Nakamurella aerolata]NNG36812.1 glycine betaine ABC transporter substrate-binding protein [Nakamurella aerolata]